MKEFLSKYKDAHQQNYHSALSEMRNGRKTSHWMWYIFPQTQGLGHSETAKFYAIQNLGQAKAYLADPILGSHLREILTVLLEQKSYDPFQIFGYPDNLKFQSSLTLFAIADETEDNIFNKALMLFYSGEKDTNTLQILQGTN